MTNYPYILFTKSPEQLRRIGARGGKAQARNRRLRLIAQAPVQPQSAVESEPAMETPAEAMAALDAKFPWLRGAEKRTAPGCPQRWTAAALEPTTMARTGVFSCGSLSSSQVLRTVTARL